MKRSMHPTPVKARQRGLSLIELMISITLGLLITLAVVYVFAGSRASHRHQENLSAVQESGRMALELLTRDIRMAGHAGCGNPAFLDHRTPAVFSNVTAIEGVAGATPEVPDSITLMRGSSNFTQVLSIPTRNQIEVVDAAALGVLVPLDPLLVSNCALTEVFRVRGRTAADTPNVNVLNAANDLSGELAAGAVVMRLETVTYSVVGNELRRRVNEAPAQAVAGGVANMQFFYGIDDTGADRSVDRYVENPAPTEWVNVVAVRVQLMLTEGDISLPFSTTITVRNRAS